MTPCRCTILAVGLLAGLARAQATAKPASPPASPLRQLLAQRDRQLAEVRKDLGRFAEELREREKWCREFYPQSAKLAGTPFEEFMRYCVWESSSLKKDQRKLEARRKYFESLDEQYFENLAARYGNDLLDEMAELKVLDRTPIQDQAGGSFSVRTPLQMLQARRRERAEQIAYQESLPKPMGPMRIGQSPVPKVALDAEDVASGMPPRFVDWFLALERDGDLAVSAPTATAGRTPQRPPSAEPVAARLPDGARTDPSGDLLLGGSAARVDDTDHSEWVVRNARGNSPLSIGTELGPQSPKDVEAIRESRLDLARTLLSSGNYDPHDGLTWCNTFVRDYAREGHGYEFPAVKGRPTAAEIVDHVTTSTDWMTLTTSGLSLAADHRDRSQAVLNSAIQYANDGYLVVVGWRPPAGNGHVAIIVPDAMRPEIDRASGNWGGLQMPFIVQAGADSWPRTLGEKGRLLSAGFGPDKAADLVIAVLRRRDAGAAGQGNDKVK